MRFHASDKCLRCYNKWQSNAKFLRWETFTAEYAASKDFKDAMDDEEAVVPDEEQCDVKNTREYSFVVNDRYLAPTKVQLPKLLKKKNYQST